MKNREGSAGRQEGPTADHIDAAREIYERCSAWRTGYEMLARLCAEHPGHHDVHLVYLKVNLVNHLYGAGLRAPLKMAVHLRGVRAMLDGSLSNGSSKAVEMSASTGYSDDVFWAFATKYCHFHSPAKFPICDRYAEMALHHHGLGVKRTNPVGRWYEAYREAVRAIAASIGTSGTFADVDKYLWLKGQRLWVEGKKSRLLELSREIQDVFRDHGPLVDRL